MNPDEFIKRLQQKKAEFGNYVNNVYPKNIGDISLRFIDKNFRDQGWHGNVFQPWAPGRRKGAILVKSGTLRRGNHYTTTPGITHVTNNVRYASVHNNGFKGTVHVKGHSRYLLEGRKVFTGRILKSTGENQTKTIHHVAGITNVKAHTRIINIAKRQFFPTSWNDSPVLQRQYVDEIKKNTKRIFG